jgi:protein arginine kinase activator
MAKPVPCSVCGAPATVHLTQIVQSKMTKVHLCEACAEKGGAGDPAIFQLAGALAGATAGSPAHSCPNCGLTDADFLKRGRLGCPDCWIHLSPLLTPLVRKVQQGVEHLGRGPAGARSPEHMRRRLEAARGEMRTAVETEDYEAAARLRDLIRELESQLA